MNIRNIFFILATMMCLNVQAQTTADTTKKAKPIIFAQQAFGIDGGSKQLKVAAVNTKGDTSGFNFILCNLFNYSDETSSKWWVTSLTEPAEGSHLRPWVVLAKLGESGKSTSIDDVNFVAYVRGLIEDTRNLSPADIRKAGDKPKKE
jgi:hypothetical protein